MSCLSPITYLSIYTQFDCIANHTAYQLHNIFITLFNSTLQNLNIFVKTIHIEI